MYKILIVDDNEQNLTITSALLEKQGFEVITAGNGLDALNEARKNPPEVIISDILMPVMDGFSLCREWKKDDLLKEIPLIFYTATYTDSKDKDFGIKLGAERYIIKPAEPDLFLAVVEEVLNDHRAGVLELKSGSIEDDTIFLREYNETLIHKLEDKLVQVEDTNKRLKEEIVSRKKIQRALSESEMKYRSLFEESPISLLEEDWSEIKKRINQLRDSGVTDFRSHFRKYPEEAAYCLKSIKVQDMNKAALDLYEADDKDELINRLPAIYSESAREHGFEEIVSVAEGQRYFSSETVGKTFSGKSKHIAYQLNVPPGYMNTLSKVFVSMIDITESKQAEEEKVMLQAQLLQSQKMEAIGTLAGGIAHDLNNILGAVIGYAELALLEKADGRSQSEKFQKILNASDRAKDLVNQILTFCRKTDQHYRSFDVIPVIKETVGFLRSTVPTTVEIQPHLMAESTVIKGDPNQIHQVMINLCTNAAHAMKKTGGLLEIKAEEIVNDVEIHSSINELNPGRYIKISVSDTGHGMDKETRTRIFEPYFTTKELGEGTGLGLSVVHGIVISHGGAVNVHSELGKGATFTVFFPVIDQIPAPENNHTRPIPRGNERIFYIDDEEDLVEIGRQMLEDLGYHVVTETNSLEAWETFRRQTDRFDLVITDQTMSGMTGAELALKILMIRPDMPIIICTGYSDGITADQTSEMGIKAFLMKPLKMRSLAETIRGVLG